LIYFIHEHIVLGKTPANEAGIDLELGKKRVKNLMKQSATALC